MARMAMKILSAACWLIVGVAALPGAAYAVRAADTPPPVPEVIRAQNAAGAVTASGRSGQITVAEVGADTIEIDGIAYRVVERRTQVFRNGRPVPLSTLVKGLRVQYNVSPGGRDVKVLGVVHAQ